MRSLQGGASFGHGLCENPSSAAQQIASHVILEQVQSVVRTLLCVSTGMIGYDVVGVEEE